MSPPPLPPHCLGRNGKTVSIDDEGTTVDGAGIGGETGRSLGELEGERINGRRRAEGRERQGEREPSSRGEWKSWCVRSLRVRARGENCRKHGRRTNERKFSTFEGGKKGQFRLYLLPASRTYAII